MLRKPKALLIKPSILEYSGVGMNIQTMKSTAKRIARTTCNFCLLFIQIRFIGVKSVTFRLFSKKCLYWGIVPCLGPVDFNPSPHPAPSSAQSRWQSPRWRCWSARPGMLPGPVLPLRHRAWHQPQRPEDKASSA